MARRSRGFTLVELMIGLAILAILMLLAAPTFSTMRGNARIRNTAESIANGMRLAQVEALRRNRAVEFQIVPATGWRIFDPDPAVGGQVQAETFDVTNVVVDVNPPGATMLTWSGIGAYVDPNPSDASAPVTFVNVSSPATPNQKDLRIVVGPALGQGVRVCDPDYSVVAQPAFGCP
ncbi:MAG: GspH/FimT family pseudopilin [Betaproteobacteria bacterium]|jgi:type IV fimbrial biogenesis protein FimT|nr:GspH/FimT family pseudopilin [Betaproteobacteria bacterium]